MSSELNKRLEAMLAAGNETSLLRFTLGKSYVESEAFETARTHLERAVALDPQYSVAWKFLGKACMGLDDHAGARDAWSKGLACAQEKGDSQVVKELTVFLRRLDKV